MFMVGGYANGFGWRAAPRSQIVGRLA